MQLLGEMRKKLYNEAICLCVLCGYSVVNSLSGSGHIGEANESAFFGAVSEYGHAFAAFLICKQVSVSDIFLFRACR